MTVSKHTRRILVEDFTKLTLADFRKAVGGRRKFNQAASVLVQLPSGESVRVMLTRVPANRGGPDAMQTILICPVCKRLARALRVVVSRDALMCQRCLREQLNAVYSSQNISPNSKVNELLLVR